MFAINALVGFRCTFEKTQNSSERRCTRRGGWCSVYGPDITQQTPESNTDQQNQDGHKTAQSQDTNKHIAIDRDSAHETEPRGSKTRLEWKSGRAVQQLPYKRCNTWRWPHEAETCREEEEVDESFSWIVAYRRTKSAKQTSKFRK
jgi:hypothetical protein